MFTAFFYLLRARGLDVSPNEWMTLLEALQKGLHGSTLTGFYHLCRAVIVKSETEFDRFDQVFMEFFKAVPYTGELPEELLEWLEHPSDDLMRTLGELKSKKLPTEDTETILRMLHERLAEQNEEHNGGAYWLGTQGRSLFGNDGWRPESLRVGGEGQHHAAALVAGERRFQDFRKDRTLDTRQFQAAFRTLRQFSSQSCAGERVLDVEGTISDTCRNAGRLKLRYAPPRKNAIKLLLLMDSGGSMMPYAALCSQLFHAAQRANQFKELHTFYFHNCIYDTLFKTPELAVEQSVPTEWLLQNFDDSYRVILVGDAEMSRSELYDPHYNWDTGVDSPSGLAQMERLRAGYPYLIWLNPKPLPERKTFWTHTHFQLADRFRMLDLTIEGLEKGMRCLMHK